MRILLAEDDEELANNIKAFLHTANYVVVSVDNGVDAEFQGDEIDYSLVILDIGLPQRSGLQVLKNWRKKGNKTPVLMLTARNDWSDRVDGLKLGADDYMGKPFHAQELLARVEALIRRSVGNASIGISLAGLYLDEYRQEVTNNNAETLALTHIEYRLLWYFMTHADVVLSKNRLIEYVYEGDSERDANVIEVYVKRLRHKIGQDLIQTKRFQGYVFKANDR
ncbi:MAG TPA: response regulator transcription factor [Oceanospirillales bacterium]|nr:response regulator transcription factor [Oceanospirillales bacterium]